MTLIDEYEFVASEISELEHILATISEDRVLERYSFETRLHRAKALLSTLSSQGSTVCLIFKGKAVDGTRSISADFGAKALEAFSDVFATVAVGAVMDLSSRGPLPEKEKNLLRIVGTAIGSFGFELELPQDPTGPFTSPEDTMQKIESLLKASSSGSDDDVTDVAFDLPSRATNVVNKFLNILVSNESWCGLTYKNKKFYYDNLEQVKKSAERLADNNVQHDCKILKGKFKGILPIGRTFEFLPEPSENDYDVIRGKIDSAIIDTTKLNREWLEKLVQVKLHFIQIGRGKPRYALKSLNDLILQGETP